MLQPPKLMALTLAGDDSDLYHPQLSQNPEPLLTWLAYQGSDRHRTYHVVHTPPYDHSLEADMTDNRQTARFPKSVCVLHVCLSL